LKKAKIVDINQGKNNKPLNALPDKSAYPIVCTWKVGTIKYINARTLEQAIVKALGQVAINPNESIEWNPKSFKIDLNKTDRLYKDMSGRHLASDDDLHPLFDYSIVNDNQIKKLLSRKEIKD